MRDECYEEWKDKYEGWIKEAALEFLREGANTGSFFDEATQILEEEHRELREYSDGSYR